MGYVFVPIVLNMRLHITEQCRAAQTHAGVGLQEFVVQADVCTPSWYTDTQFV
jgi:hypothetical protein